MNKNNNNNNNNSGKLITQIPDKLAVFMQTPIFGGVVALIILTFVFLVIILSGVNLNDELDTTKKSNEIAGQIFIVIFILIIVLLISVSLLKNFKELKDLFMQISSVVYVMIYTVFLVLFFGLMPNDTIDNFDYLIVPVTMILGFISFYMSFKNNYLEQLNINYERIKSMILFFCLITIIIVYYNNDPGGIISDYFGYSLMLTIITSVFAFLYLIILITLEDDVKESAPTTNLLSKFTKFNVYGSIIFLLFIISITIYIATYSGGFFTDKNKPRAAGTIIMVLIISILFGVLLISNMFTNISADKSANELKLSLFKRSLLIVFGGIVSIMIIVWLVYNLQHLSGESSIISFIINTLLMMCILALIYKAIVISSPTNTSKKGSIVELLFNIIFYIPCVFTNLFDELMKMYNAKYDPAESSHYYIMIFTIILFVLYFCIPILQEKIGQQGGILLINQPIYTNNQNALGSYADFTDKDEDDDSYDYNYALSFWVFFDAFPPSTKVSYSKYTSLLNYADKPNILYNATENTLLITMKQDKLRETTNNKLIEYHNNGHRILYKKSDVLLQKWNNIIINYDSGIMDIFLNGELVKSNNNVVPYYTHDNLTVGDQNGYIGGLCNLVYHKKTLSANNIYYIYNSLKDKSPPITNNSSKIIMQD